MSTEDRYVVTREGTRVLEMQDRPGFLVSTAPPPPDGPVVHPWINAVALDMESENELGSLLTESTDFDDYVTRLRAAGFTVSAMNNP